MGNFEKIYAEASKFYSNQGSNKLKYLLRTFYENCISDPIRLSNLKKSLITLLEFLSSPEGRKQANLGIVDLFVCFNSDWDRDIDRMPEPFRSIIEDMGGALHDTIKDTNIAVMFDSTPEILLKRAKKIKIPNK